MVNGVFRTARDNGKPPGTAAPSSRPLHLSVSRGPRLWVLPFYSYLRTTISTHKLIICVSGRAG